MDNTYFEEVGTWWGLPRHRKLLRWLKVMPKAYLLASLELLLHFRYAWRFGAGFYWWSGVAHWAKGLDQFYTYTVRRQDGKTRT